MVIQSPPGWGWDRLRHAAHEIGAASPEEYWHQGAHEDAPMPGGEARDLRDLAVVVVRETLA